MNMSVSRLFSLEILVLRAKMTKYHNFGKFLAKKHCLGNKWQSTTFSRTRVSETQVPH